MTKWIPTALFVFAVMGAGTDPAKADDAGKYNISVHADSAQSRADEKEVIDAVVQIRNGKIQQAIDGPLTDVVNRYEKAYRNRYDAVFSARGPAQGLMYMAEEASKHIDSASGNKTGQAIDVGPAWSMAYWGRGYGYSEMNRFPDAEVELKKALALSPRDAQYTGELAYVYQMEGRFAESLALFERVPEFLDTMDGWENTNKTEFHCSALRGQGYNLVELHRLDDAEKAYKACIALIPNEPKSLAELGYIEGHRAKGQ
jgi:tetratricopeptide (TPR) repeat protein